MTTNGHDGPRHLDPITAMMKAIPAHPRHAAPDTGEMPAQRPPVPPMTAHTAGQTYRQVEPRPEPHPPIPPRTRSEDRKAARTPRWRRWLLGEE